MASADFPPPSGGGTSPGKSALVAGLRSRYARPAGSLRLAVSGVPTPPAPRTTARFTSTTEPVDFAVLCQLVPSCRRCSDWMGRRFAGLSPLRYGSIWFLFIGLRVSSSLPPPGRLPSRSWLQLVIYVHVSTFWFFHRGLSPHLQRAHAGRTQNRGANALKRAAHD